jgi:hypothetical protein
MNAKDSAKNALNIILDFPNVIKFIVIALLPVAIMLFLCSGLILACIFYLGLIGSIPATVLFLYAIWFVFFWFEFSDNMLNQNV